MLPTEKFADIVVQTLFILTLRLYALYYSLNLPA